MDSAKEEIKKWLKSSGISRDWLAEQCLVSKAAVDEWFKKRGVIPTAKLDLITSLMNREKDTKRYESQIAEIKLTFYGEEWDMISRCAKKHHTTPERWIADCVLSSSCGYEQHQGTTNPEIATQSLPSPEESRDPSPTKRGEAPRLGKLSGRNAQIDPRDTGTA